MPTGVEAAVLSRNPRRPLQKTLSMLRVATSCRGNRAGCGNVGGFPPPQLHVRTRATTDAFTLIELLVVIAIITVLAGLILSTMGYVQKKGARSRAETEIAAMSAACES